MRTRRLIRVALSALAVPVVLLCFSASAFAAPEVPVTREAKSVTGVSAVFDGELNPLHSGSAGYEFAYNTGPSCEGGMVTPEGLEGLGREIEVSTPVTGLTPSTEYTVCVVATFTPVGEPTETTYGQPYTFTTHALAPEVVSEAKQVTPFEAHLEAAVNPENQATSCVFQYGPTSAYGKEVPCEQGTLSGGEQSVSATIPQLAPHTVLHFRVLLQNTTGKTAGTDTELTTSTLEKPLVENETSSSATPFEETVSAEIDPGYQATTCEVEYGPTTSYGKHAVCSPESLEGGGLQGISQSLAGLEANKTYHYRVVAKNETGKTEGPDHAFATPSLVKPTVEGESASGVTPFEGTLEARLDPDYQETSYSFQYATEATGETLEGTIVTLPGTATVSGGPGQAVNAATGKTLTPGATYYYRVIATNATGSAEGPVEKLEVPALLKPVVEGENASFPTPLEGTLEAQIEPDYQTTTCEIQYGLTTSSYGPLTHCDPASLEGGGLQGVSLPVSGLQSETTYHFRVLARNGTGETEGLGQFTTPNSRPLVEAESVAFVTSTGATLQAQINPNYREAQYIFEYATEESLLLEGHGTQVPGGTLPAGNGGQAVHADLRGVLTLGTKYYYRVLATNTTGTTAGMVTVNSFKTPIPPTASTGAAENITRTTAKVTGTINPEGQDTHYSIQYGPTPAYGYSTTYLDAGAGEGEIPTGPIALNTLSPGTTYYYRLVAANSNGETTTGAGMQFTTTSAPPPPLATTGGVNSITNTTAQITGTVNPLGLQSTDELDYGREGYPGCDPEGETGHRVLYNGTAVENGNVIANIAGLEPGSVYYYRVAITTADGTVCGAVQTFTTPGTTVTNAPAAAGVGNLTAIVPVPVTKEPGETASKPKSLTRAQKLAKALKTCKKSKGSKRAKCEKQAHARYGKTTKKKGKK